MEEDPIVQRTAPMKEFLVTGTDMKGDPILLRVFADAPIGANLTAVRWLRANYRAPEVLMVHDLAAIPELTQGISEVVAEGGCPSCEGRGVVPDVDEGPEAEMPCPDCGGTGQRGVSA